MRTITFTPEDRRNLAHVRFHHPDPRVQRKMEVLWLKSHGLDHDTIATYADVSRRTVQRYLDQYLEGGLPRLRRCPGPHTRSVLGALDAVTHQLVRVTNHDYINAESVCALLRAVAEAAVGLPITLVRDNARYQKCALVQALAESLGIELLYLPSCSPNLNLIERLWRFVRQESLNSTYYEAFEQFTTAIDQCLDGLPTVHKSEMETLLTHEFQMFGDVPLLAA
jgi:transposase